jgi:peptidyl-prolyl cis-trans isomerase D
MMKFLRSQSQTVLVVVLGVIALGFLFYGNSGNFLATGVNRTSNDFGRIDGDDLTVAQLTEAVRDTRYALIIQGQGEKLSQPGASREIAELAWQQLLLRREAERLHVTVSDKELADYIKSMPPFQKDGVYSPEAYDKAMGTLRMMLRIQGENGVDPVAMTKDIFATVVRNELTATAVSAALFTSVRSSAHDVGAQYEKYYGPATVSFVTFDPQGFVAAAQVTPDEIAAEYKAHPMNPDYRTKDQRKVDYVMFTLTPDQMKLPEAQKTEAKNALGEKATKFALALIPDPSATGATPPPPDFNDEAKKEGLMPTTTDFFFADTPPAGLPPSPSFNNAAFALTKESPISKVIDLDNGVAVMHLVEIKPSDLRPLAEVQDVIKKQLQQNKGMQAEQQAAEAASVKLKIQVATGKDFKAAATADGYKVDTLPTFVPAKVQGGDPRAQTIAYAIAPLKTGEVSGPVPVESDNATLVLHVDSRAPADPAGLADFETRFRDSQDQQLRNLVSNDWANWKSKQPGTHRPPDLDAYGSVE